MKTVFPFLVVAAAALSLGAVVASHLGEFDDYPASYSPGSAVFWTLNSTLVPNTNNSWYTLIGLTNFRTRQLYVHTDTRILPFQHWQQLHSLFLNTFERTVAFRRDTGDLNGTYTAELVFLEYEPDRAPHASRRFPSCVLPSPSIGHQLRPFVLNGVAYAMDSGTGVVSFILHSHRHDNTTCQLSPTPATTFCQYPSMSGTVQWTVSSSTTLSFILGGDFAPMMLVNVKAVGARGLVSTCYTVPPEIFPPNNVQQCGSALAVDQNSGVYYFSSCAQDAPGSPLQLQTTLYEGALHATNGFETTWRANPYWSNLTYHDYTTLILDARNATAYGGPLLCAGGTYAVQCFTKYWQAMWDSSRAAPSFGFLVGYDPNCF